MVFSPTKNEHLTCFLVAYESPCCPSMRTGLVFTVAMTKKKGCTFQICILTISPSTGWISNHPTRKWGFWKRVYSFLGLYKSQNDVNTCIMNSFDALPDQKHRCHEEIHRTQIWPNLGPKPLWALASSHAQWIFRCKGCCLTLIWWGLEAATKVATILRSLVILEIQKMPDLAARNKQLWSELSPV